MENLEQPINENLENFEAECENNASEQINDIPAKDVQTTELTGSNLFGKFKDAEELMKAYNSLQAEFTRKCQKLSSLENSIKSVEEVKNEEFAYNNKNEKTTYSEQEVEDFLKTNPSAKQFAKEISLEIINDKSLNLQDAYNKVLLSKIKEPSELIKDQNFLENYVFNDENIKSEMLKRVIKRVEESNTPQLISGKNGVSAVAKDIKISSLEEANRLAYKLFNN